MGVDDPRSKISPPPQGRSVLGDGRSGPSARAARRGIAVAGLRVEPACDLEKPRGACQMPRLWPSSTLIAYRDINHWSTASAYLLNEARRMGFQRGRWS